MVEQTQAEQFAAFQAWQAQQAANPPATPDTDVPLTIAEVLHGIVNVIGLATESLAHAYHAAITDWHELQTAVKEDANDPRSNPDVNNPQQWTSIPETFPHANNPGVNTPDRTDPPAWNPARPGPA